MGQVHFEFSGGSGILSDNKKRARLKQPTVLEEIPKYAVGQSVTRWLRINRLMYILHGCDSRLRKI